MSLPPELLVEVFLSLDSIGRVRCRRVCPLWNSLLTTGAYFPDVRVFHSDADYNGLDDYEHTLYWMMVCLLKCLHSTTKMVIAMKMRWYEFGELENLMYGILQATGAPSVVFYKGHFVVDKFDFLDDVVSCLADLVDPGGRVVWRQCLIGDRYITASVAHHSSVGHTDHAEVEKGLWEAVEKSLTGEPMNGQALAKWIADCTVQKRKKHIDEIVQVLNHYQRADPRELTRHQHGNREWKESDVPCVDVGQLTTLTAAALSALASREMTEG
ncbi:uncharacterized protein LOC129596589 [Paramacrobiotus metropolitanus]|uniref:uncharacterized protein LOC129596589 n=1 Tax=Paramacrobiotus metropolitanus TaxID=2943436 RepID=UPI0024462CA9|nr:uncharacterized protein LOC129596589 [Paramacrobiotus metropolitanus]